MNTLLMMMGGSGTRYGADIPKQYIEIDGKPIFSYIIENYDKLDNVDYIVVVSHEDWVSFVEDEMKARNIQTPWSVVKGGDTRSESVLNGLTEAMRVGGADDVALIHDATHPYVDAEGVTAIIDAVNEFGGATLGAPEYDTMYQMTEDQFIDKVIPRQLIVSGASPEAFKLGQIYDIYKDATVEELNAMTSAGAIALAHNIKMKVVPAQYLNLKITYPGDMILFRQLVHNYFFNTKED